MDSKGLILLVEDNSSFNDIDFLRRFSEAHKHS